MCQSPWLRADPSRSGSQCYMPTSSACPQEWRFFRKSLPPFDICHGKDFIFLVPDEDSSTVSCVHCWLWYHPAPVRRVWFHLYCTLPWGAAANGRVLPESSLLWAEQTQFLASPASSHFPAPHHLLHWTLTGMWISPLRGKPPLNAIHQILFPKCQGEGNNHFPSPSDFTLVNKGPMWLPPSLAGCADMQQSALSVKTECG